MLVGCGRLGSYSSRDDADECVVNTRVELLADVDAQVLDGRERLERLAVGTLGSKGVKSISGAKDSRAEWNGLPREAKWIAGAIPMLVVMFDVLERLLDVEEWSKDVEPDLHVSFDVLEFLFGQAAGLVENSLTYSDFTDVV